jgi:hypothetical protein
MLEKSKEWYEKILEREDGIIEVGVGYTGEETCLIDEFFRNNPDARSCMISCSCPKCSPRC